MCKYMPWMRMFAGVKFMDKLKERLKQADWWEITYLIIYGAVFTFEFLNTTMFEVKWPPKFGYIFLASTALYVIAKFIWNNTYTKKEMIWAGVILFAFLMPALLTEYRFLWYTGFLIVGAKDIDFDKILKVYLVIGITIMVAAFGASQYGVIADLEYIIDRGNEELLVRHSYGIVYPTDFAAHIFYIVLAIVVYMKDKLRVWEQVWLSILAAGMVYLVANAQTSMLCLLGFAMMCICVNVLYKYMHVMEKIVRWIPVACASIFCYLAYIYDSSIKWMDKLNDLLSTRLEISKKAFDLYEIKMFGQNIPEIGSGRGVEYRPDYFFLDDVYIRILLEYGFVLFCVVFLILALISKRAAEKKQYMLVIALLAIAIHSVMEHHLLEVAYNPMIISLFAIYGKNEQESGRKTCIEKTVKAG